MDVTLRIDPASGVPLHRQVYEAIRGRILNGVLRPGDRLPATRTLAEDLALSRTTVSEAYEQLQAEGYLLGKHGSGTYVAPNLSLKPAGRPEDALQPASRCQAVAAQAPMQPPVTRAVPLSNWGQRISSPEYASLLHPAEQATFAYDFRPHRVAEASFPMDAWRDAVDRALAGDRAERLFYSPSAGHPDLQEAIAGHVARYRAVTCGPEQVVIVNGSQQGLNLLAHLLFDRGDRVAVEDPGYPAARLALEAQGLDVSRIPVDHDGMIVDLLAASGAHRLVHVTPSHQDPTGATMSLARRLALLDLAERSGCVVVEDDYDSEFRYEGRPVESLQGLDRNGLVVYAGTFSKSVLAGLRLGFLVLPPHLVGPFVTAKSLWDSGTPMLEQAALAEFLRSGDFERHIRRMRRLYALRRDALVAALARTFGDTVCIGERHGGLNILVTLYTAMNEADVAERAAASGVGLRMASPYYTVPPERATFLMGFAAMPEAQMYEGVQCLARAIS